ncbi:hypothetical protein GQ600_10067 [Phytophthora cactorum]|nr:hypothetical protein GQ600_10067 [Phytophthora cactorum]
MSAARVQCRQHQHRIRDCLTTQVSRHRATSAKWSDIVKWGAFDGKSRIAFYTGKDCTGTVKDWDIKHPNGFPATFFWTGSTMKFRLS